MDFREPDIPITDLVQTHTEVLQVNFKKAKPAMFCDDSEYELVSLKVHMLIQEIMGGEG